MSIVTKTKSRSAKGTQPEVMTVRTFTVGDEPHFTATAPGSYGPALVNPNPGFVGRPSYDVLTRVRVPVRTSKVVEKPSNDILRALARAHAAL